MNTKRKRNEPHLVLIFVEMHEMNLRLCSLFPGGSKKLPYLLLGCLSVGFVLSVILIFVLAFIVYKLKKQICLNCKGRTFRMKLL